MPENALTSTLRNSTWVHVQKHTYTCATHVFSTNKCLKFEIKIQFNLVAPGLTMPEALLLNMGASTVKIFLFLNKLGKLKLLLKPLEVFATVQT